MIHRTAYQSARRTERETAPHRAGAWDIGPIDDDDEIAGETEETESEGPVQVIALTSKGTD